MVSQREVDKLVEILEKQVGKYNEKQIKSAILAEGYSEDVVKSVLDRLFPKQKENLENKVENNPKQELKQEKSVVREIRTSRTIVKQEVKEEQKETKPENENYYKEVNYLLEQLKDLNKIKKPEINTPNLLKENINPKNNLSPTSNSNVNSQIELKKQELQKIKIENDDDEKIITKDGRTINLNDYPRREWRNYRDTGKSVAETKEEQMQKIRQEIYALKKSSGRANEVVQEEHISEKISERVRQKAHGRISEKRIDIEAKNEAEKLREKYKSEEVERKDLDLAAENIYTQMMKNPNIYGNDETDKKETEKPINLEKKKEIKKPVEKKDESNDLILDDTSNTDTNSNLNTAEDLSEEFNLNLDLNAEDKKK